MHNQRWNAWGVGRGRAALLVAVLACHACAPVAGLEGPPRDLRVLAQEALRAPEVAPVLLAKDTPVGPEAPYTPLMQPPQVQRAWVPDHLNAAGDLISGHWVYLLLAPSRWFLESAPASPEPVLRTPQAPPVIRPPTPSQSPRSP